MLKNEENQGQGLVYETRPMFPWFFDCYFKAKQQKLKFKIFVAIFLVSCFSWAIDQRNPQVSHISVKINISYGKHPLSHRRIPLYFKELRD
jgi:hypothetical protein